MRFEREGMCRCGEDAVATCQRCGRALCDEHARTLPPPPEGLSDVALGTFGVAVRLVDGPRCMGCRAEQGRLAAALTEQSPRKPLPEHWLDRALALCRDPTRNDQEKAAELRLPDSLTPAEVVAEFLRRMDTGPAARVQVDPGGWLRRPDYAHGWKVMECRRTEYTQWWPETWFEGPERSGRSARFALPALISTDGKLLGPALEADETPGTSWHAVPESDIDLERLVSGVARILVLRDMGY